MKKLVGLESGIHFIVPSNEAKCAMAPIAQMSIVLQGTALSFRPDGQPGFVAEGVLEPVQFTIDLPTLEGLIQSLTGVADRMQELSDAAVFTAPEHDEASYQPEEKVEVPA